MLNIYVNDQYRSDIIIIHIKGAFYMDKIAGLEQIWNEQVSKKPKVIAINCSGLEQIDSSAIGHLVKFLNNAMDQKIRLIFFELNPGIMNLFVTAKLNRFFSITTKSKFEAEYLINI